MLLHSTVKYEAYAFSKFFQGNLQLSSIQVCLHLHASCAQLSQCKSTNSIHIIYFIDVSLFMPFIHDVVYVPLSRSLMKQLYWLE